MLFAGRERQDEPALAIGIDRFAAQPARHLAHEFLAAGQKSDIGTTKGQRVAQRLTLGNHNVGAEGARCFEKAQGDDFGDDDDQQSALCMGGFGQRRDIAEVAVEIRGLNDNGGGIVIDMVDNIALRATARGIRALLLPRGR